MESKLKFLESFKPAIRVLTSTESIDEETLNLALYELMSSADYRPITYLTNMYFKEAERDRYTFETQQRKIRQMIIALFNELNPNHNEFTITTPKSYCHVKNIFNCNNLRSARNLYRTIIHRLDPMKDFDFEVYCQIMSVSQRSEMNRIIGFDTKMLVLHCYFVKFVNEILDLVYEYLFKFNIIETKGILLVRPNDFNRIKSQILAVCKEEKQKVRIVDSGDKMAMLKEYCHPTPSTDKNLQKLIGILDDLKDRYEIPYACDKKKFAAIAYNLYRCQLHIGMRGNAFKTYAKFKNVMCSYFDMPQSTYKVNDIESISKMLMRDLCFKDFKLDAKWLTENGNEKKRKKRSSV